MQGYSAPGKRLAFAIRNGGWGGVSRTSGALHFILATPLAHGALTNAEFGLWATLASIQALSGFMDFGLGSGAINPTAAAAATGDRRQIGVILKAGTRVLVPIALAMMAVAAAIGTIVFHAGITSHAVLHASAIAALAIFIAAPASFVSKVQLAAGHGRRGFIWSAAGQASGLLATFVASTSDAGLEAFVASSTLLPAAFLAINAGLFTASMSGVSAKSRNEQKTLRRKILSDGSAFFVIQCAFLGAFSLDLLLITLVQGAESAADYALVQRLFSIVPMALGLAWVSIWPLHSAAIAHGQLCWAVRMLRRSTLAAASVAAVAGVAFAAGYPLVTLIWLGDSTFEASPLLLWGMAAWVAIEAAGTGIAIFLNACGILRPQVAIAVAFAMANLPSKFFLLHNASADWMPWANVATYVAFSLVPALLVLRHFLRSSSTTESAPR